MSANKFVFHATPGGPPLLIQFKRQLSPDAVANLRDGVDAAKVSGKLAIVLPDEAAATIYQLLDGRWVPLKPEAP